MAHVSITFSEKDELDHDRSMTYQQAHVYTTEDLEYFFIKAATAWGFQYIFEDYDILKMVKDFPNDSN